MWSINIPLSKMNFHIDNGYGEQLEGTQLVAQYNFISKTIEWRKCNEKQIIKQNNITKKLLQVFPLISPFVILSIISLLLEKYTDITATPYERLQGFAYLLPIILGILVFLGFEYLLLLYMKRFPKCASPAKAFQVKYFKTIYDFSIKYNNAVGQYKTPYLVNIIVSIFTFVVVIPLMFGLYNQPDTTGTFFAKLFVLSVILSLVPNILWNMVIKAIVIKKILNRLESKY